MMILNANIAFSQELKSKQLQKLQAVSKNIVCQERTLFSMSAHLVALPNIELHDTLLGLVEHRGGHRQAFLPVVLLAQETSQLLEGGGFVRFHGVCVAIVGGLALVIQLHLCYQERFIPVNAHTYLYV